MYYVGRPVCPRVLLQCGEDPFAKHDLIIVASFILEIELFFFSSALNIECYFTFHSTVFLLQLHKKK